MSSSRLATPNVRVNHPIAAMWPVLPLVVWLWYSWVRSQYRLYHLFSTIQLQSSYHKRHSHAYLWHARIKIRFINFNRTLERRLLFTRSNDSRSQFQMNTVSRVHRDAGQCRRNCSRQIHGKTAQKFPEFFSLTLERRQYWFLAFISIS